MKRNWLSVEEEIDTILEDEAQEGVSMKVEVASLVVKSSQPESQVVSKLEKNVKRFKKAWNPQQGRTTLPKIIGKDRMFSRDTRLGAGKLDPWLFPQAAKDNDVSAVKKPITTSSFAAKKVKPVTVERIPIEVSEHAPALNVEEKKPHKRGLKMMKDAIQL
jgi:hypothetical protein